MKEARTDYPTALKKPLRRRRPRPHPIYGNATAEDVALKLRRNVAKPQPKTGERKNE